MGTKQDKKARRIARDYQTENTRKIILTWVTIQMKKPLKQRLKFAWQIIKGMK